MKTIKNMLVAAIAVAILGGCSKKDTPIADQSIEGTYIGTLTASGLKSTKDAVYGQVKATATVTKNSDSEIEVHCFSDELDTTFMFNYFDDDDSVMVCLSDSDFEEMYDEMMDHDGRMGEGMMNHQEDETDWQYLMNNFPQADTLQIGGFDRMNHSFGYQFEMVDGDTPYNLTFQGTKQ